MPQSGKGADLTLRRVGAHIRALREAAGYSQDGLANEAGLDRSYYAGIERGERNVAVISLYKIAEALHVTASELLP